MKIAAVLSLIAVTCVLALPPGISNKHADPRNNAVETLILQQLEELRQTMLDNNLDPLELDKLNVDLSQFGVVGHLHAQNMVVEHLSTFVAEQLSFSYLTQLLRFTFHIPVLEIRGDNYDLLVVNEDALTVTGNGAATIRIHDIRVVGSARVVPSLTGPIQVQDCQVTLKIGQFEPHIQGLLGDGPHEEFVNAVLADLVPELIHYFDDEISAFLSKIIEEIINELLRGL